MLANENGSFFSGYKFMIMSFQHIFARLHQPHHAPVATAWPLPALV